MARFLLLHGLPSQFGAVRVCIENSKAFEVTRQRLSALFPPLTFQVVKFKRLGRLLAGADGIVTIAKNLFYCLRLPGAGAMMS